MFKPKNYVDVPTKPVLDVLYNMNVYFRNEDKTLGAVKVEQVLNHKEAIAYVKESLGTLRNEYKGVVLAVVPSN